MSTQRYRTINYAPLEKQFNDKNCTVEFIDLPKIKRSYIANVHIRTDKAPLYFHTTERKEIVSFTAIYIPYDTPEGRKLLPYVKESVEEVLKSNYNPEVATIQLSRDGKVEDEVQINDCVITAAEIMVDLKDYIRIKFYLQGLLIKDF
jgi:hypothetical protein